MKLAQQNNQDRAVTLVEILAVVSIIILLIILIIGIRKGAIKKADESRLKVELAAIELALEKYKEKHGNYPPSSMWGSLKYPSLKWDAVGNWPTNNLYGDLVSNVDGGSPFLRDVDKKLVIEHGKTNPPVFLTLCASVRDQRSEDDEAMAPWYYNCYDPKYNKGSYDLWVEYGEPGDDGVNGTEDDIVRIIKNW